MVIDRRTLLLGPAIWLAVMLYILPLLFVYEPALLGREMPGIVSMAGLLLELTFVSVLVAVATQGWLIGPATWPERAIFAAASAAGVIHIATGEPFALLGELGAAALGIALQRRGHHREAPRMEMAARD
jgi:TRAP-type uncharacterized transport system fused permease subunit